MRKTSGSFVEGRHALAPEVAEGEIEVPFRGEAEDDKDEAEEESEQEPSASRSSAAPLSMLNFYGPAFMISRNDQLHLFVIFY